MATSKKKVAKKAVSKKKVSRVKRAPRAPRSPRQPAASKTASYTAKLEVNEKTYTAKGTTALEALTALNVPVQVFKTKMYLRLFCGSRESSVMFLGLQFRRFYNSRTSKEIWAKRLEARLQ